MTFRLSGLPEGVIGKSVVRADSLHALFASYPALAKIRKQLEIRGTTIRGYLPCLG
jgi:hypothetical protein